MADEEPQKFDAIPWARRVNSRWIVHHGLREAAQQYLDHLERTDPNRLARSCLNARQLTGKAGAAEDPKPWFYAGLFSLATASEVKHFLKDHSFTASAIPALAGEPSLADALANASAETRIKIARIREAVQRIPKP